MFKNIVKLGVIVVSVALLGLTAAALTADKIMDMVDAEADALAEGSMISTVRWENNNADGTTTQYLFASLSKPNRLLLYHLEPSDVRGTILLMHDAEEDGENRLWLYLPFIGKPKEMVSDDDRESSFAGSSLSYEDLSDREGRADYDATLIGEEDIVIGDLTRTAYKIESTAKPGTNIDNPHSIVWIDIEFLIMLKMESYNDLGNLDSTMEVLELAEFEEKLTASVMLSTDVSAGSSTTITISDRRRPDVEISEDVFLPENTPTFDAALWGFADQ